MKNLRLLAASLAVTLVSLLAAPSAEALSITLQSGLDVVTVTDGGPGDGAIAPGIVSATANVGVFEVVLTAGFSVFGSPASPLLLYTLEAFSSEAGTLNVSVARPVVGGVPWVVPLGTWMY